MGPQRFPIILLWVFLFTWAHAAEVNTEATRFKTALDDFKNGSLEKSRTVLERLVRENPSRSLYCFNLGNAYFALGKYSFAISAYRKVIDLKSPLEPVAYLYMAKSYAKLGNTVYATKLLEYLSALPLTPNIAAEVRSDLLTMKSLTLYQNHQYESALALLNREGGEHPSADAELLRGMILLQTGNPDKAKTSFEAVIKYADDEELRQEATRFFREISDEGQSRSGTYWLFLDSALGYNSNLFGNGPGQPATAVAVFRDEVGTGGIFLRNGPYRALARYALTWDENIGLPSERFVGQSLDVPLQFEDPRWLIEVTPTFQYQMLGNVSFLATPGGRLRANRYFGAQEAGLQYETGRYYGLSDYGYLSGPFQFVKAHWGNGGRNYFFSASYVYSIANTGDEPLLNGGILPLANHSTGPGASISWIPVPKWQIESAIYFLFKNYNNPDLADGIERSDKQFTLETQLSYRVNSDLKLYWHSGLTLNSSTLGANSILDENYTQFISYLGFTWDALP